MAQLSSSERARLPDSAFAYIDSRGRRRLPIHDEAHVRNALARFDQVRFEDDEARQRSRKRLLNAAKRYGIVPVGFITGQLQAEREQAATADAAPLPSGFVTLLLTDIEGSTGLLRELGDEYPEVLNEVREIIREALGAGGREVEARADEFFAVFERPVDGVRAGLEMQRALAGRSWSGLEVRIRVGIHSGEIALTETGYVGLSVHTAARVCSAAHGGQILITTATRAAVKEAELNGVRLRSLGRHRLAGLPQGEELFQVEAEGLPTDFPLLRT